MLTRRRLSYSTINFVLSLIGLCLVLRSMEGVRVVSATCLCIAFNTRINYVYFFMSVNVFNAARY